MNTKLSILAAAAAGIAGGVVATLLLSPKSGKENREWLSEQTEGTREWLGDKGKRIREESEKRIDRISQGVKKTIEENVPDLYKATEEMSFESPENEG